MPTMRLTEQDKAWAVVGAIRVDAPSLTYIVGRQTNDTRIMDGGEIDAAGACGSRERTASMSYQDTTCLPQLRRPLVSG